MVRQNYSVSFDQYQRYKMATTVVELFRNGQDRPFRILEIGSNAFKYLKEFLPDDSILYTDLVLTEAMEQDPAFQKADGTQLPFEEGSFDFVIATDVLEHIPFDLRKQLFSEAIRVAKIAAVITFPYDSPRTVEAEERLNAYYKALYGQEYRWLNEHRDCGLPKLEEIELWLSQMVCAHCSFCYGDITLWEKLNYSLFDACNDPVEWAFKKQVDRYYMDHLFCGDSSENCYRALYVLAHTDVSWVGNHLLDQLQQVPREAQELLDLLLEAQQKIHRERSIATLCQKQLNKEAYVEELLQGLAKKDAHIVNLQAAIEGQKVSLHDLQHEIESQIAHIAVLQKELADKNAYIGALENEKQALHHTLCDVKEQYHIVLSSFFWKVMNPMRRLCDFIRRRR